MRLRAQKRPQRPTTGAPAGIAWRFAHVLVLVAILAAAAGPAAADDAPEMWRTAEEYMACGRGYLKSVYGRAVEGARSACAKGLDA